MKFTERLSALGHATYDEYLRSSHWTEFKVRYHKVKARTCVVCGTVPVELHHHTYERLGAELLTDVTPLCREHHAAVHEYLEATTDGLVRYTTKALTHLKKSQKRING